MSQSKYNLSRYVVILAIFTLAAFLIYRFSTVVIYVLLAWVVSMLGQPLMVFFQKYLRVGRFKTSPSVCAALTIVCFFLLFGTLGYLFVPPIVEQIYNLSQVDFQAVAKTLESPLANLNRRLTAMGVLEQGKSIVTQLQPMVVDWVKKTQIGDLLTSFFATAGNALAMLTSVVFISFFFLREQNMFTDFVRVLVPVKYEQHVRSAMADTSLMLTRYFRGITLQILSFASVVTLGLMMFGVENSLLIGFFGALMNVVPYLGPIIGATFGVIITISSHLDVDFYGVIFPLCIRVLCVFSVAQMLDGFVFQPLIISNSVTAHPLEIFIVILIGAQIYGIGGMILAIPTYTVVRSVAKAFLGEWRIVQKFTDDSALDEVVEEVSKQAKK